MKKDKGLIISHADFDEIYRIAKNNQDIPEMEIIEEIYKKYYLKKEIINAHKKTLFSDVKKYKKNTVENKQAYDKHKEFKDFVDIQQSLLDKGAISLYEFHANVTEIIEVSKLSLT